MAIELAPHDIRVVTVAPGDICTEASARIRTATAKYKNVRRNPKVSLAVFHCSSSWTNVNMRPRLIRASPADCNVGGRAPRRT
jgi:NAD(P)-dependent dehydrogenase (short-subunit alcohol dehydrogenase family)